ncbi:hypothetical protein K469DRAFT_585322 [Zopfia rhizophila CBS 207.26]|uniref:Ribonucleases P/MRP subunit Pop8-like domain-containing protein n=1 Tax=Zopfia rhizophila CBS 207.26 TaxID=1314779 RepID=A0A6A6DYL1_9PEZI|nr:hypothetical protein K469DRAFT_585322 [Zopfia rhizophila CBS 207.26]
MAPVPASTDPKPTNTTTASTNPTNKQQATSEEDSAKSFTDRVSPPSNKRKRNEKTHVLHQSTFKKPLWGYLHLELITPGTATTKPKSSNAITPTISAPVSTPASTPVSQPQIPSHISASNNERDNIDPITTLALLTPPLTSFLGLIGSGIQIDILKIQGREVWIRVPRQDSSGMKAGLGSWVGWGDGEMIPGYKEGRVQVAWRVKGSGEWLGSLSGDGDGRELFDDQNGEGVVSRV